MARPTKLTPDVQEKICEAIRHGATYQAASEAAGVAYSTFNDWHKDLRPRFVKFSEAIRRANADAQLDLLAKIANKSKEDWRAAAWILERRFKNDFGQAIDLTTAGDKITVKLVKDEDGS
jgi:transposase